MNFKHIYLFLVLFVEKFIPDINNEHAQDYSCWGNFSVLFTWRKVTSARQLTRCCTMRNLPLEDALGQRQTHVNSYRHQTMHRGKVDPGVSELPQCNELSRNHVNRPQLTGPRVNFASVHGLTPVTVHMSFSLPRGNFERQVTHCTTSGNPPCRGNFAPCEQNTKVAPGQE